MTSGEGGKDKGGGRLEQPVPARQEGVDPTRKDGNDLPEGVTSGGAEQRSRTPDNRAPEMGS